MDTCGSCQKKSQDWLPVVAIVRTDSPLAEYAVKTRSDNEYAAVAVCDTCWNDATARPRPIKGHFFMRRDMEIALERAGSSNLGG